MVIIHGVYRWLARQVAFRRDYCRKCEDVTLAVRVRTLNVLHLFWIPILPLGVWARWLCVRCGTNPHAAPRTRLGFKVALVGLLLLFNVAAWIAPAPQPGDTWIMRAAALLSLLLATGWVARHRPEPDVSRRLAAVAPYDGWNCPLCGGELLQLPPFMRCPNCRAEHRPLRVA